MPFGKYRGRRLADVPTDYLLWLLAECDLRERLKEAVEDEVERRRYHSDPEPTYEPETFPMYAGEPVNELPGRFIRLAIRTHDMPEETRQMLWNELTSRRGRKDRPDIARQLWGART